MKKEKSAISSDKLRLDKYLWSIRIFKTRSLASEACDEGKVKMNDSAVKASKAVNVGDIYTVRGKDRNWIIKVKALLETRKAYSDAIQYYDDLTPVEEQTKDKQQAASFYTGKRLSKVGRPTKKDRRGFDEFFEEL